MYQPVAITSKSSIEPIHQYGGFTQKQIEILKNTICKGASDDEFEIFLMACMKSQLDPFMKQIYAVMRNCKKSDGTWGKSMTIQTGIDGYRAIAERTGCYAPGPEPTYQYDKNGSLLSSTAYIKKRTHDGTWHTISASAYFDEYCQKGKDGQPMGMWANMPRTMLAKCAESQALRKSFPSEMSGIYTAEEMSQSSNKDVDVVPQEMKISLEQAADLQMILDECDEKYREWAVSSLAKNFNIHNLADLPVSVYERLKKAAVANMEETRKKQQAEFVDVKAVD